MRLLWRMMEIRFLHRRHVASICQYDDMRILCRGARDVRIDIPGECLEQTEMLFINTE